MFTISLFAERRGDGVPGGCRAAYRTPTNHPCKGPQKYVCQKVKLAVALFAALSLNSCAHIPVLSLLISETNASKTFRF